MPKNAYFLKKSCKIAAATASGIARTPSCIRLAEISALRPERFYYYLLIYNFVAVRCYSVKRILLLRKITEITNSKCSAFASSTLLRLIFLTSNSAAFVGEAQR